MGVDGHDLVFVASVSLGDNGGGDLQEPGQHPDLVIHLGVEGARPVNGSEELQLD